MASLGRSPHYRVGRRSRRGRRHDRISGGRRTRYRLRATERAGAWCSLCRRSSFWGVHRLTESSLCACTVGWPLRRSSGPPALRRPPSAPVRRGDATGEAPEANMLPLVVALAALSLPGAGCGDDPRRGGETGPLRVRDRAWAEGLSNRLVVVWWGRRRLGAGAARRCRARLSGRPPGPRHAVAIPEQRDRARQVVNLAAQFGDALRREPGHRVGAAHARLLSAR